MTNKLPEAEFFYGVSANCPLLKLNLCIDRLRLRPGVAPRQHQSSGEDQTGLEPAEREQGHFVEIKSAILQNLEASQFQSRKYTKLEQAFLIFLM